jgi:hypothetical protein
MPIFYSLNQKGKRIVDNYRELMKSLNSFDINESEFLRTFGDHVAIAKLLTSLNSTKVNVETLMNLSKSDLIRVLPLLTEMTADINYSDSKFWLYHNWRAKQQITIHRGECKFCKEGKGMHLKTTDKNGQWHSDIDGKGFKYYIDALNKARELQNNNPKIVITDCRRCNPY